MIRFYLLISLFFLSGCYVTNDTTGFQCDELYMLDYNCNLNTSYNFIEFTPRVPRSPYWDAWGYPTQYYYDMGCPGHVVFPQTTYIFIEENQSPTSRPRPSIFNNNDYDWNNSPSPITNTGVKPKPNLSHEGNRLQSGEYKSRDINGRPKINNLNKPNAPSVTKRNN